MQQNNLGLGNKPTGLGFVKKHHDLALNYLKIKQKMQEMIVSHRTGTLVSCGGRAMFVDVCPVSSVISSVNLTPHSLCDSKSRRFHSIQHRCIALTISQIWLLHRTIERKIQKEKEMKCVCSLSHLYVCINTYCRSDVWAEDITVRVSRSEK